MYNRDYEEYMRSVLGYKAGGEVYNTYDNYNIDYSNLYPEIYTRLDPIISKVCSMNTKPINDDTINEMINAIITNVNLDEYMEIVKIEEPKLRNGDVRNPNAKEGTENRQRRPGRLLQDLIKILILNKLLNFPNQRPPYRPGHRMDDFQSLYNNNLGNKYPIF